MTIFVTRIINEEKFSPRNPIRIDFLQRIYTSICVKIHGTPFGHLYIHIIIYEFVAEYYKKMCIN